MTTGRLIVVVGPSGVGKDSLMDALCAARPGLHRVRRVITRAPDAGGECFEAVSREVFARRRAAGAFALSWQAHGLHYAIPADTLGVLEAGDDALANLSRAVLAEARAVFPPLHVLSVTAPPEVLAQRLAGRGREPADEVSRRLGRAAPPPPADVPVTEIDNGGALEDAAAAALAALYPDRGAR